MIFNQKKTKCSMSFGKDCVVAVVLNLDVASPNGNTVSLFKDGVRASQPQPLPDALKDVPLFPAVSFKSTTVHLNFAAPAVPLPFTCRSVQEASSKDAAVKQAETATDGKYTVLFPVCMPDEGAFDW